MNSLLSFRPEPFADLDREVDEFESPASKGETNEAEEEVGRRRRPRPARGTSRGFARTTSVLGSPKARIAPPPTNPSRTLPRLSKGLRPIPVGRLIPTLPFIPPLIGLPSYQLSPPPRDVTPADDNRRTEQARSEGSGNPPATQATEEPGSEYIRWVQNCLNRTLGLQLPVDGIMTRETRSAIRSFQERQGLPLDGLVGPETETALKSTCDGTSAQVNNTKPAAEAEWGMQNPSSSLCHSSNKRQTMNYQLSFESEPFAGNTVFEDFETLDTEAFDQRQDETRASNPLRVRWIQESLNKILGLQLKVDGIMGPQTRSAIRRFQQKQGLVVDGIVGPKTEAAFNQSGAVSTLGISTSDPAIVIPPVIICGMPTKAIERFRFNQSGLVRDPFRGIDHFAEVNVLARQVVGSWLTPLPIKIVCIEGHTDEAGSDEYNYNLGMRRALAVGGALRDAIVREAINAHLPDVPGQVQIIPSSGGELFPVTDNQSEESRARNRRVEVAISHDGIGRNNDKIPPGEPKGCGVPRGIALSGKIVGSPRKCMLPNERCKNEIDLSNPILCLYADLRDKCRNENDDCDASGLFFGMAERWTCIAGAYPYGPTPEPWPYKTGKEIVDALNNARQGLFNPLKQIHIFGHMLPNGEGIIGEKSNFTGLYRVDPVKWNGKDYNVTRGQGGRTISDIPLNPLADDVVFVLHGCGTANPRPPAGKNFAKALYDHLVSQKKGAKVYGHPIGVCAGQETVWMEYSAQYPTGRSILRIRTLYYGGQNCCSSPPKRR